MELNANATERGDESSRYPTGSSRSLERPAAFGRTEALERPTEPARTETRERPAVPARTGVHRWG
ncbi:hypothetical protein [Halostagnicola kamekurae]|uniref:Uncharacterized protein n=1 Tax=Halostagnicola kamekurae TaxID=619731 RepID=A0A1I6SMD2_9EURY|nr:hypothetical protein [Halostagnicola kamekurae]SFS78122.1 hypothetical protein SAMN04488556_2785 [Halostagnicola kamekurae]